MKCALLAVGALLITGPAVRGQDNKFQGTQLLLDPKMVLEQSVPATQPAERSSANKNLPVLQVRVLLKKGTDVPEGLQKFLMPLAETRPVDIPQQFVLVNPSPESIRMAVEYPEVARIEVVPPSHVPPPMELVPFNLDARLAHNVNLFEVNIHNGGGATVVAAIIDGGSVRKSHIEFQTNRVSLGEPTVPENAHSTHVAGTMAATGNNPQARGMAPKMKLLSYSFSGNDLGKLEEIADKVQVSNHSYGPYAGWARVQLPDGTWPWLWFGDATVSGQEDVQFGRYTSSCQVLDAILVKHPQLLSVVAAGNDRSDGPPRQPVLHYIYQVNPATGTVEWVRSSAIRNTDGFKSGGLDTIAGLGVSKNALCVGAINDLFHQGGLLSSARIETTYFSSWGPTDDGRIKPDVVANGQALTSPTIPPPGGTNNPDNLYEEMSGTSMACPTASGIASVLAEYFQTKKGRRPFSPEIKALLIHTATDAGEPGPDPKFGYGSINALRAGEVIRGTNGDSVRYEEVGRDATKSYTYSGTSSPVRVTIAWLDPPAHTNTGPLNDSTRTLQNDLDLTVISPDGKTHFPYQLNRANPLAPAICTGPNAVDNVEMVEAPGAPGTWKVEISATGLQSGDTQRYAIVISGLRE